MAEIISRVIYDVAAADRHSAGLLELTFEHSSLSLFIISSYFAHIWGENNSKDVSALGHLGQISDVVVIFTAFS